MHTKPIHSSAIRSIVFASVVLSSLAASMLSAQAHTDSFTYQGQFLDNGEPANGFFDMGFNILDSEVGGNIVPNGFVFIPNVEVVDGNFETFVDFGSSGTVFDSDQTQWLQINVREVGDVVFTALLPRQRMAPTPLANYSLRSGTTLQDAYLNNPSIFMDSVASSINIRSTPSQIASVRMINESGLRISDFFENTSERSELRFYGFGLSTIARLSNDASTGGGGELFLARNDQGFLGARLEGNRGGSQGGSLTLSSAFQTIDLDVTATTDQSVRFPNGAINASETLSEAGAAESALSGLVTLTNNTATIDVISSVTINAPSSGFVLVLASAEVTINHVNGTNSSINIGVSNLPNNFSPNTDLELRVSQNAPTGFYEYPVTAHAIYPVSQGANTFYFNGDKNFLGNDVQILDRQLTAVYLPTAYGSLSATSNQGSGPSDQFAQITGPMTPQDISNEREASLRADLQRQQREIDAMKAQMQQLIERTERE